MRPRTFFPHFRYAAAFLPALLLGAAAFFFAGCEGLPEPDRGANRSLVGIGERYLERAEELEDNGRGGEANALYRRALWAFTYHHQLTGEEALLTGDARDGIERTGGR